MAESQARHTGVRYEQAIAAACHYAGDDDHDDQDIVQRGLRWGVTKEPDGQKPGHCSMSDGDVGRPIEGSMYM